MSHKGERMARGTGIVFTFYLCYKRNTDACSICFLILADWLETFSFDRLYIEEFALRRAKPRSLYTINLIVDWANI